jgi:hypothetical protein
LPKVAALFADGKISYRLATAAQLAGGGIIPNPLLAELIRGGATIRPVRHPGDTPAELRYRPSTALDEFVRCRDLTNVQVSCCDEPAEFCDIDHTVRYPLGLTHPSNLKCLCRKQVRCRTVEAND